MAEAIMRQQWTLTVDNEEFRLILQALGGRLIQQDHQIAAQELGDRLTEIRISHLRQMQKIADDAIAGMKRARLCRQPTSERA